MAAIGPPVIALLPPDAPFNADQRAWLNGFFAGLLTQLATQASARPIAAVQPLTLSVLFASQTGTAEGLAKKLGKEAKCPGLGLNAQVADLGGLSLERLAKLDHVIIIASTHGEGDPPDSAGALKAQLDAASGAPLVALKYAVLALGDRSYARFCHFGKWLDERLALLGGTRLVDRVDIDGDATVGFKAFREGLWPVLSALSNAHDPRQLPALSVAAAATKDEPAEEQWTRRHPFPANLRGNARLTGPACDKEVRHIALDLLGSELRYQPGDALGVWPENPAALVDALIDEIGLPPETLVVVDGETQELRAALATRRELAHLAAPTLIKFAALSEDAALATMVKPEHTVALERYRYGKDILDLIHAHPRVVRDGQQLMDMLPPLLPRLYSIASSPDASPGEVHLTIATVRYDHGGRARGGVASTWLADRLAAGATAPVYVQRNTRFRLSEDPGIPLIMIGPGTGIAPFRAFLHHRRAHGLTGRTWLFFGARHAQGEFLYEDELRSFLQGRELGRLDTAFSRDQRDKIYVQHRMLQAGRDLCAARRLGASRYSRAGCQRR